ncbi:ArsR/SmtB family transcription factor [Phytohabitans aurantiacus]|uniref:Transcriptional regulator n=1 Tax=Phytohabitans aurantiacus TaxID=3016789 RepID=A0ABQ5RBG2_9ACTN|nr:transcriptional regulator [Phytohabitans aurantiacus]GLI03956.1 transcriptional regulator [Phytohabitans aurantiacus]
MVPLHQAKAEFFRMLGHPVRIRVLELLGDKPMRRAGIVTATREGNTARYALPGPDAADLMRAARRFLTGSLANQSELLDALHGRDDSATLGHHPDRAAA